MDTLHKKLFRAMLRSRGQSLAVVMVVMCGIASYICMRSAYLNLKLTRDTYYAQQRLADFEILLERAPATSVFKVEDIPGVRRAYGRIVQDVNVDVEGVDEPRVGRLISMPNPREQVADDIVVMRGRYFDSGAQDEVILSDRFAEANNLGLGDRVKISVENKKYTLRIVGLALSPEYVYMIRNLQEMFPNPERFGIFWVPEDFAETALDMKAACNSILGMVDDPEELDTILDRADKLLEPYGVFAKTKQDEQISPRFLADEIKGLSVSAKVVPTLFLAIAALVLLVLLNRMVRIERTQIGLMKAYGYSNFAVAFHYIEYGLVLSMAGCLGGVVMGQWMAGGMVKMYVQFYQFPLLESRIHPEVLAHSMGSTVIFSVLGALTAAVRAARIQPAEAMRPETPRKAQRVWLEQFPRLWRQLSFTWKMIMRNISRNSFRASLNVFGVAIAMALLIMGFFGMDVMEFALKFQFEEVQREDVKVSFQGERGKETYYEMTRFDHVRRAEPILEYPFEIRNGWRKKDVMVVGIPKGSELQRIMTFDRTIVPIEGQDLVVSDRLARTLDIGPGSRVILKPLMGRVKGEKEVTVRRVAQQFLGTNGYMDLDALSALLDESFAMSAALLRVDEGSDSAINKRFKDVAGIASVSFTKNVYQSFLDTIGASMWIMNFVVLLFSGVIAISIIYNVTAVALSERQRELASLRVLGLTQQEVGRIMYHENMVLGSLGIAAGIPLGILTCKLLVRAYDTDLYRMPYNIEQQSFVYSMLLTAFFVLLANWTVRNKIQRLDLVEVLKERE